MQFRSNFRCALGLAAGMVFSLSAYQVRAESMRFAEAYGGGTCAQCAWIAAEGEIEENSAEKLAELIQSMEDEYSTGDGRWLFINSPGGNLAGGIELGRLIRRYGIKVKVADTITSAPTNDGESVYSTTEMSTYAGGVCASACVLAFMGGVEREIDEESQVGLHQFASTLDRLVPEQEALSSAQSTVALLTAFAAEMGVSPDLIALASSVPAEEIYWLQKAQMERARLVTTIALQDENAWQLEASGSRLFATVTQPQRSGRRPSFVISCGPQGSWLLSMSVPLIDGTSGGRRAELAAALTSVELVLSGGVQSRGGPYSFAAEPYDNGLFVTFAVPDAHLRGLLNSTSPIFVEIEASNGLWDELGGFTYLLPRSNLSEVFPHVGRTCS